MTNYKAWLRRAIEFVDPMRGLPGVQVESVVASPLNESELRTLAQKCRLRLPAPLQQFWTEASGHCHCKYWWFPPDIDKLAIAFPHWSLSYFWGGAEMLPALDVVESTHFAHEFANDLRPDFAKDARFWENTLPFVPVGNGDYVGLFVEENSENPPVAYLCHEGCEASGVIARSFDEFLIIWEQLRYVGIHFLLAFVNPETKLLDPAAFPEQKLALDGLFSG